MPESPPPTAVGIGNSLKRPEVVTRPMLATSEKGSPRSVNQSAPSGPAAIPSSTLAGVGTGNSLKRPEVVTRPIWLANVSVNQSAPSDPPVIAPSPPEAGGLDNALNLPEAARRPSVRLPVNQSAPPRPPATP